MSEYDEDEQDGTEERDERTPAEWAKLRKTEKARKDAEKEASDTKRELAFLKAGIPMDDPRMAYFVKGYDGDLTADAIKAQAVKDGFLTEQAPEKTPEQQAEETQNAALLAAQQRQTLLAQGGLMVGEIPAEVVLEDAYQKGGVAAVNEQVRAMGIKIVDN